MSHDPMPSPELNGGGGGDVAASSPSSAASPSPAGSSVSAPDDRASTFRAVTGQGETVPGGQLLIAAYAMVWLLVMLMIVRIFRRQNRTARDLASLEATIAQARDRKAPVKARAAGEGA